MISICSIPYIIGIIIIIKYLLKIIDFILKHFLLRTNNLKEKYGDGFALITGGSSGIGLSFAKELLKINYKICLLSSNIKKLVKAQKELLTQYPK